MKKILYSYHGLGDNIIMTPVLKKYREVYPDDHISLTYLKRLPVIELLEDCPYVDEWVPIRDVWNDFASFEVGYEAVLKGLQERALVNMYDEIIPVTMSPQLGITHKIHRAAHELKIEIDDYKTEIFPHITDEDVKQADEFLEMVEEPYVFVHLKTGNSPKDVKGNTAMKFLEGVSPFQVIEYGSNTLPAFHLPLGNIALEMEILSRCSRVICADSFIMHAAGALGIPITAVFLSTPPEWVIPLHEVPMNIYVRV
jgi:ADP-heptose:LPS heptosyltransferase